MLPFAALAVLLLLLNKRFKAELSAGGSGLGGSLAPLVFGAPLFRIRFRIGYIVGTGPVVSFGGGGPRPLKRKKRGGKGRLRPLGFLSVRSLSVSGRLGIEGAPDLSVILSGALLETLCAAAAYLSPREVSIKIEPELQKTAFDLKVEGILTFSPGRLMIEIIKSKRRKP